MANDAESGLAPAKRISPLNAGTSDAEASKHLDTLSEYLGIRDLTVEDSSQGLLATPFIGTIVHPFYASCKLKL